MFKIYFSGLKKSAFALFSSSLFLLVFSEVVLGMNSSKQTEAELPKIMLTEDYSEIVVVSSKSNNVCEHVKNHLPAIEKTLDRTMKMLEPLVESANKYVEDNTGISPDEIALWFQKGFENAPRIITAFLEDREITVKYYSTDSPLPFVIKDCEIEPNLSRRISAPGGYVLIKYDPK